MKLRQFGYIAWLIVLALLAALIFNMTMTSFDHNEHMYVTAGVLVSQGLQLYADFAYLQTPYLPLLYGILFDLTNTTDYLFMAKSLTLLFLLGAAGLLYLIALRSTHSQFLAFGGVTLFLLNTAILRVAEESSNYVLPITASFLAYYFFLRTQDSSRWVQVAAFLSGLCVAFAAGTKLYYALIGLPFLLTYAWFPRTQSWTQRATSQALPFLGGALAGSVPLFFFVAQDPQSFLFNNLEYHQINAAWREMSGDNDEMTLPSKLHFAVETFREIDNLLLLAIIGIALWAQRQNHDEFVQFRLGFYPQAAKLYLAFGLLLAAIPAILMPTPVHDQYYAMPISLAFLPLIMLYPAVRRFGRRVFYGLLLGAVAVAAYFVVPSLLEEIDSPWIPHEVDSKSRAIAEVIPPEVGTPAKIATITPIFALEANLPIYPELATGPFLYRVGDFLTQEELDAYEGISPQLLPNLLAQDLPAAILVSHPESEYADSSYQELEKPLRRFAEEHGYHKVERLFYGSELYIAGPLRVQMNRRMRAPC